VFPICTSHSGLQPFEEIPKIFVKNVQSLGIGAGPLKSQVLPLAGLVISARASLGEAFSAELPGD